MTHCKWWNIEQDKCIHPNAPQNGDCDWCDEDCPYDEQISEQEEIIPLNEMKCPLCGGKMEMYEHYDYYNDNKLQQEQNYECMNCHDYTTQLIVNYVEISRKWNREEIG